MIGHWEKSGQWDIRIQDPTRHDNGTYQCIVVTKDGAKVMDADLLVKVPPTLPIIVEPSSTCLLKTLVRRLSNFYFRFKHVSGEHCETSM